MKVYVDDVLVKSRVSRNHLDDLFKMFEVLWKYGIMLNPLKCFFGVVSRKFLGFIVNARGIGVNLEQINTLRM